MNYDVENHSTILSHCPLLYRLLLFLECIVGISNTFRVTSIVCFTYNSYDSASVLSVSLMTCAKCRYWCVSVDSQQISVVIFSSHCGSFNLKVMFAIVHKYFISKHISNAFKLNSFFIAEGYFVSMFLPIKYLMYSAVCKSVASLVFVDLQIFGKPQKQLSTKSICRLILFRCQ